MEEYLPLIANIALNHFVIKVIEIGMLKHQLEKGLFMADYISGKMLSSLILSPSCSSPVSASNSTGKDTLSF